jgi:Smg protein
MFEVLAFVYENYANGHACPELITLHRKLSTLRFASDEIQAALLWLEDLRAATHDHHTPSHSVAASPIATRLFTLHEQNHLGLKAWGFLSMLRSIGAITCEQLELTLDCAMAAPGEPVSLDDLKLMVLMVFWGLGQQPDALVFNELCNAETLQLRQ